MPTTGGNPSPIIRYEHDLQVSTSGCGWSPEGNQIYFRTNEGNFWELSLSDTSIRQLSDLKGRYGFPGFNLASDSQYLYFQWNEDTGDLWVMDVVREE